MMSEKRKRRKWKVIVVLFLLLLAAPPLFVWIVKVRSDRAWNEFVAKWEAQGEHFEIAPLAPPKVPDADNLALHPAFAVRKDPISGLPIKRSENPHSPAIPDEIYDLCYDPFLNDPANPDPREWFNLPPNSDPADLSDHLGEQYREWMIRLDDAASALREREQFGVETDWSKFLIDDEESSGTLLTSMTPVSDAARAFQLRSAIRRGSGDTSGCANDIESILRLARAQAHLPLPFNRVVQTGSVAIAVDGIKYGLASGLFTEPELIQLERELAKAPSGPELFRKALRFERALCARRTNSGTGAGVKPVRLWLF